MDKSRLVGLVTTSVGIVNTGITLSIKKSRMYIYMHNSNAEFHDKVYLVVNMFVMNNTQLQ